MKFQNINLKVILGVVVLVVLVIIGWNLINSQKGLTPQMKADKAILDNENSQPHEVYQALRRLSRQNVKSAKGEAMDRMRDPSPMVRAAAAEALGHYEGNDVISAIKELMDDSSPTVRSRAVIGLGYRGSIEREKLILEFLKKEGRTIEEKVASYEGLIRMKQTPDVVEDAIKRMVEYVLTGQSRQHIQASYTVMSLAPSHPAVVDMLKQKLLDKKDRSIVAVALRHLSAVDSAWLENKIQPFVADKDMSVRRAVLDVIPSVCPKNRWEIIEGIFGSKANQPLFESAIRTLQAMPGKKSSGILKNAIDKNIFDTGLVEAAKQALVETERTQGTASKDPCLRRGAGN